MLIFSIIFSIHSLARCVFCPAYARSRSEGRGVWGDAERVRNILFEVRNKLLRHENHVAWTKMYVLTDVLSVQKILEFELTDFRPVRGYGAVKENLSLCRRGKPARNRNGLRNRNVIPQIILPGLS